MKKLFFVFIFFSLLLPNLAHARSIFDIFAELKEKYIDRPKIDTTMADIERRDQEREAFIEESKAQNLLKAFYLCLEDRKLNREDFHEKHPHRYARRSPEAERAQDYAECLFVLQYDIQDFKKQHSTGWEDSQYPNVDSFTLSADWSAKSYRCDREHSDKYSKLREQKRKKDAEKESAAVDGVNI